MELHYSQDRQLPPAQVCDLAMAGLLISGPAGAGKSAEGMRVLAEAQQPTILVEFQEILAFLLGLRRDRTTSRYPERRPQDELLIPIEFRQDESRESPGRLVGVLLPYEVRAGDRPELFEQGALRIPDEGVLLREMHRRDAPIMKNSPLP